MLGYNVYIFILITAMYILAAPHSAQAYLDAGTGSYLIQLAIAFIAGGLFMMKIFWQRLLAFFARGKKSSDSTPLSSKDENTETSNTHSDPHE